MYILYIGYLMVKGTVGNLLLISAKTSREVLIFKL